MILRVVFVCKQKPADEWRSSEWSSDVCSSDLFLTGTDEHGQKGEAAAAAAGVDPQGFTDRVSQNFRDLIGVMDYSTDDFIRTTEPRHVTAVQELWRRLKANGHIYPGSYAGWYSVRDEAFYTATELTTVGGQKRAPHGAPGGGVGEPDSYPGS